MKQIMICMLSLSCMLSACRKDRYPNYVVKGTLLQSCGNVLPDTEVRLFQDPSGPGKPVDERVRTDQDGQFEIEYRKGDGTFLQLSADNLIIISEMPTGRDITDLVAVVQPTGSYKVMLTAFETYSSADTLYYQRYGQADLQKLPGPFSTGIMDQVPGFSMLQPMPYRSGGYPHILQYYLNNPSDMKEVPFVLRPCEDAQIVEFVLD